MVPVHHIRHSLDQTASPIRDRRRLTSLHSPLVSWCALVSFRSSSFQDEAARISRIFGSYAPATRRGCLVSRFVSVTGTSYPYPQAGCDAQCAWFRFPTFLRKKPREICRVSLFQAFSYYAHSDSVSQQGPKWVFCVRVEHG